MSEPTTLLDRIQSTRDAIAGADSHFLVAAADRQASLTKPPGSLGRLEAVSIRIAAIAGSLAPALTKKRIFVVAGDHGITAEGVSAYPSAVTHQMVLNFLAGGAAINVLARHGNIEVQVVDAGVDHDFNNIPGLTNRKIVRGTRNFAIGPAMTREQAEQSIVTGIELATASKFDGVHLIGIGEMGIGNTTSASAITMALTRRPVRDVTGTGTGIDAEALERKVAAIERGLAINKPIHTEPIDILSKVGGAEIGVMMGIVLGCAAHRIPLVADGFISTAAAALAVAMQPIVRDYVFIAHRSKEAGHQALIDYIGMQPLLDLDMRLGEGTGAALAMHVIDGAVKILCEMATFESAGVSDKNSPVEA